MTIVLIKLKWLHYNLNSSLSLNCVLSPNWLRWMLAVYVTNGWESLTTLMTRRLNECLRLTVFSNRRVSLLPMTSLVTRRAGDWWMVARVWPCLETWAQHSAVLPKSATGNRIKMWRRYQQLFGVIWNDIMMRHNWELSRKLELYFNSSIEAGQGIRV